MDRDEPRSIRLESTRAARRAMLELPHLAPLTAFVREIRAGQGLAQEVPYFDPLDGGVAARCLYVLEAPGRMAVASGFVSRNNNDETARNFFLLNQEAGIPREWTVNWNTIPWYVDESTMTPDDVTAGVPYLRRLLALLPALKVAVLVGRSAQRAEGRLREWQPSLQLFHCPHPSPLYVNRRPEHRGILLDSLRAVADYLANAGARRQ